MIRLNDLKFDDNLYIAGEMAFSVPIQNKLVTNDYKDMAYSIMQQYIDDNGIKLKPSYMFRACILINTRERYELNLELTDLAPIDIKDETIAYLSYPLELTEPFKDMIIEIVRQIIFGDIDICKG